MSSFRSWALPVFAGLALSATASAVPLCTGVDPKKPEACTPHITNMVVELDESGNILKQHAVKNYAMRMNEKTGRFEWTPGPAAGIAGVFDFIREASEEKDPGHTVNFVEVEQDPFVDYAFGLKNVSINTLVFMFTFSTNFIDGPWDVLQSSHSSSITDGSPRNGNVKVTAPNGFVHMVDVDGNNVAGASHSTGCNVSGPLGFSGSCFPNSNVQFGITPTGAIGTLTVNVKFTLTPGDLISVNGRAELLRAVPEPATYAMIGAGLVALGMFRRRRP